MIQTKLPVMEVEKELLQAVESDQVVLVVGPTGSGKTTKIPQILLDGGFAKSGRIICTEPRRIAAIASAKRIADERKSQVGKLVGYQVRFEKQFGPETKLKFATVGILLREAILDPTLSEYSCVVVDEAHERDVFTDFLLGYLKCLCERRPDFRVVILSATLQAEEFLKYFPNANLVTIPSRQFAVDVKYDEVPPDQLVAKIQTMVKGIHYLRQQYGGKRDILIFLPGERDIREVTENLKSLNLENFLCLPFDGMKVIVATNVAESSITIEGMRYVIDTGMVQTEGFDTTYGIETLSLERISQSEAIQRTGRAGRTMPGTCYRLYSEQDFLKRPTHRHPEILRSDLTNLVFCMKSLELGTDFDFLTPPQPKSWTAAENQLLQYGAIDEDGRITEHGERMFRLPLEPKLAHFLVGAAKYGCTDEAKTIAAMLSVGRFFVSEFSDELDLEMAKEKFRDPESDFFTLLNIWDDYVKSGYDPTWCELNHLNPYWMKGVHAIQEQLRETLERQGITISKSPTPEALGKAVLSGFRQNVITFARSSGYKTESGLSHVSLFRDSVLAKRHPDYAVCFSIKRTTRLYAHCSHEIPKEWLADQTIDVVEVGATPTPEIIEDALIDSFLKQPVSELELSGSTEMKLAGIGIETIYDLTKKTEKQLVAELSELLGNKSGMNMLREVKERLSYFDLELVKGKDRKNSFELDSKVLNLPPALPIDDSRAAEVLGEQFPLFQSYRQAAHNYNKSRSEGTKWQMGNARNDIAVLHTGLAYKQARLKYPELIDRKDPALEFEDMVQEGCLGILSAIERFDYTRGFRFSTYATWWVRQIIDRMLADTSCLPVHMVERIRKFYRVYAQEKRELGEQPTREHMAEKLGKPVEEIERIVSSVAFWKHFSSLDAPMKSRAGESSEGTVGDFIELQVTTTPDDEIEQSAIRATVAKIFETVPFMDTEKESLDLYFGLNGNKACTLDEIGGYLGVTRERIRQILEKCLERLRTPRVYEMARVHVKTLQAPSTSKSAKFKLELGDSAEEIQKVKVEDDQVPETKPEEMTTEEKYWTATKIVNSVCNHYGVFTEDLLGPSRVSYTVRARQVIMYRLREELGLPFTTIGEILNRDHTTVIHGHREIQSEVLSGMIPLGCFPPDPRVQAIPAQEIREELRKERSLEEILDQDINVLGLAPAVEQILRRKRSIQNLRTLIEVGPDRILMTQGMDAEALEEIESALKREGVSFAQ